MMEFQRSPCGSFSGLDPNPGQMRAIPNTVRITTQPAVIIQMTLSASGPAGSIPYRAMSPTAVLRIVALRRKR